MIEFPEQSLKVIYVEEPELEFGFGQKMDHPKDGLYLYGPEGNSSHREVRVGVIGTSAGIIIFKNWLAKMKSGINVPEPSGRQKANRPHLSDFPGLQEIFGINVDEKELTTYEIKSSEIDRTTLTENLHEAVALTTELFTGIITSHILNEEANIDIWVILVPEIIHTRCRAKGSGRKAGELTTGKFSKKQKEPLVLPLLEKVINSQEEEIFDDVPDFHRQIKAKLLNYNQTCQVVRETTLAPEKFLNSVGKPIRETQDSATVAWNLATAFYYKSQSTPPWKIAKMREGVCYIGLVFKLLPNNKDNHACCAAQMFLSEGDGVVFRGANGPWYTEDKEFHMSKMEATKMIQKVLDTYKQKFDEFPKELFIHGKTKFNQDEWEAFSEAAPTGTNIVGVRIRSTNGEVKLFRDGDYPCIRGTALVLGEQDAFLWTSGYIPRIDTYMGPETPNPISVTVLRATNEMPKIDVVLADIMKLTKINYNSAAFGDSLPVTIRFAERVGEVLVMGSAKDTKLQPFKYYI